MNIRLSRLQTLILLAVAKYRFLTNSQLELMGLGKLDTLRKSTCSLAHHPPKTPLLHVYRFPAYARTGRLENVYAITQQGLDIVRDLTHQETTLRPVSPLYDADFFHRRAVITFQFLLDKSLSGHNPHELTVKSYDQYFHKTGANHRKYPGTKLEANTKVHFHKKGFFIPDSIFVLRNAHQQALFALECIFGNKKIRTIRQVQKHLRAISEGVITSQYSLPAGQDYVALFLFHDPQLMNRVRLELLKKKWRFTRFREHFLFATIAEARRDIQNCWHKAGDDRYLYNFIDGKKSFKLPP